MPTHLTLCADSSAWDAFVASLPYAQFTQSWAWGEFKRTQGHAVERFLLKSSAGEIVLAAQLIRQRRCISGYWFCPRGPVFVRPETEARSTFESFLSALFENKPWTTDLFYRFEPLVDLEHGKNMLPLRMRRQHSMNPAAVELIDLSLSRERLLKELHEKTRYNIRVAERKGVTVRIGHGSDDEKEFLDLVEETGARDRFTPHHRAYLQATYSFLSAQNMARIRLAECSGKILGASLEVLYGDTVTYLHGGSSSASRELMAPYALHWSALCAAQDAGFRYYDLGGVNPVSKANYYYKAAWEGISRFKSGWGGEHRDLIGTWDLPLNRVLYRLAFLKGSWRG